MRKSRFLLLLLAFSMVACGSASTNVSHNSINIDEYTESSKNTGVLGAFDLISPHNNMIVESVDTFSWSASENAEKYTLEICSNENFISDSSVVDYYKKDNISTTTFKINSNFVFQESNYYWRVTAKNSKVSRTSTSTFSFFVKAPEVEEVRFDIGDADDWQLHPIGSYADIGIDRSNFFGNGMDSLSITFKQEDTNRGVPESDGWIVVSRTIEKSIYGTDALYFNMYYAGLDADIIVRLLDRDNEYWYCPVQVSNNAKQSVILKFSDFIQRVSTDVVVNNQVFDFERIKYFEVVFEHSFGDGALLISDIKAIKFSNYNNLFIDKLHFDEFDDSYFTFESYNFELEKNDTELVLNYYGAVEGKQKINGYGFAKLNVKRYFVPGDAIKVSIKYSGSKGTNVILRIYEEDTDRWSYSIPFANVTGEYQDIVIPYGAFNKSYIGGDGKRQFYYISNIQFGLEGQYSTGKLYFKDFEITHLKEYITEEYRVVDEDGLIDDFSSYRFSADMYKIWTHSQDNKDEYLTLNTSTRVIGNNNKVCGQFQYKADMPLALYYIPVKTTYEFSSISMWLSDQSIKSLNERAAQVKEWNPDVILYIRLVTGEIYTFDGLKALSRVWHDYSVPFTDFELSNREDLPTTPNPIKSTTISHVGISMQYEYKDSKGQPLRVWAPDNPVLIDNIYFNNRTTYRAVEKERTIHMEGDLGLVDDFENYENNGELLDFWANGSELSYQKVELSNNVSSRGGNHSMALQLMCNAVTGPTYYFSPSIAEDVKSKVIRFDMAAEVNASVTVSFYAMVNKTEYCYSFTLTNVNQEWTEYAIGLSKFVNSTSSQLSNSLLPNVTRIAFNVTYYGGDDVTKNIYVDNIMFDSTYTSYSTNTRTIIA